MVDRPEHPLVPGSPHLGGIAAFSQDVGRPLRPYQLECVEAVLRSVKRRDGCIFTVMFARQMGKNETSAQLEAYLLRDRAAHGGSIVKAAPTFKPQLITSMLRLREILQLSPTTSEEWKPAYGYMVHLGRASIAFFSADRQANVVGATASLLLEIDEAQDVDPEKYDRDFRPMAAAANATTVLYGTAWGEDSLLERQRAINLAHERQTGERLHFEYDWRVLAALSPDYDRFVRSEIARLGVEHPTIQTQYLLRCLADAGRLFSVEQRAALEGVHPRLRQRPEDGIYVAGIDLAGEDEQAEDAAARALHPRKDSTVITIAELCRDRGNRPVLRVVDHVWWTGRNQVYQVQDLVALCDHWRFARIVVDASGIGATTASYLQMQYGGRVESLVFTAPSKSHLAYHMLGMINTDRLSIYAPDGSAEWRECWEEIRATRYSIRGGEQMSWGVPAGHGHDDFVTSLALVCRAAEELAPPPVSGLIRPQRDDASW